MDESKFTPPEAEEFRAGEGQIPPPEDDFDEDVVDLEPDEDGDPLGDASAKFADMSGVRARIEALSLGIKDVARKAVRAVESWQAGAVARVARISERRNAPSIEHVEALAKKSRYKDAYEAARALMEVGVEGAEEACYKYGREHLGKLSKRGTDIKNGKENYLKAYDFACDMLEVFPENQDLLRDAGLLALYAGSAREALAQFNVLARGINEDDAGGRLGVSLLRMKCYEQNGTTEDLGYALGIAKGIIGEIEQNELAKDDGKWMAANLSAAIILARLKAMQESLPHGETAVQVEQEALNYAEAAMQAEPTLRSYHNDIWQKLLAELKKRGAEAKIPEEGEAQKQENVVDVDEPEPEEPDEWEHVEYGDQYGVVNDNADEAAHEDTEPLLGDRPPDTLPDGPREPNLDEELARILTPEELDYRRTLDDENQVIFDGIAKNDFTPSVPNARKVEKFSLESPVSFLNKIILAIIDKAKDYHSNGPEIHRALSNCYYRLLGSRGEDEDIMSQCIAFSRASGIYDKENPDKMYLSRAEELAKRYIAAGYQKEKEYVSYVLRDVTELLGESD